MDLGIQRKNAIVCASSKGLGLACATALAREGCNIVINGRNEDTLESALAVLQNVGDGTVDYVVADINAEEGRAAPEAH